MKITTRVANNSAAIRFHIEREPGIGIDIWLGPQELQTLFGELCGWRNCKARIEGDRVKFRGCIMKGPTNTRLQIERLAYIAAAFRAGRLLHVWHLAEVLEVSSKTIYRDFEFLRERLNYEVHYDAVVKGWRLVRAPEAVL